MPIYAYKCGSCGHAKDVLQKMSDTPLSVCPACGAEAFTKQVTAAGFQLKGSGWYVTDFRGGNSGPAAKPDAGVEPGSAPAASDAPKTESAAPASGSGAASSAASPPPAAPSTPTTTPSS